jgi:hypothetical protein
LYVNSYLQPVKGTFPVRDPAFAPLQNDVLLLERCSYVTLLSSVLPIMRYIA